jgi:hypothetical protein
MDPNQGTVFYRLVYPCGKDFTVLGLGRPPDWSQSGGFSFLRVDIARKGRYTKKQAAVSIL